MPRRLANRVFLAAMSLGMPALESRAAEAPGELPCLGETLPAAGLIEGGRAAYREGDLFTALRCWGRAYKQLPGDPALRQLLADVLAELNAPHGAAKHSEADIGIRSRQAALMVRWGEQVAPDDPRELFRGTDTAIARLRDLLDEAAARHEGDAGLRARLQGDLLLALRDRERWDDALAVATALEESTDDMPAYARQAQADALLATRQTARALRAYERVLEAQPDNRNARVGLFFAQLEREDFTAAFATVDAMAAQGAAWRRTEARGMEANSDWLDAQVLAAQARRYADMPGEAWRRIDALARAAPGAAWLRAERGEAAAARDWPRRSHEELLIAESLAGPQNGVRLALAESHFRRRRWQLAESEADALTQFMPYNARLQTLQREIRSHQSPELQVEFSPRYASGGGRNADGDELNQRVRVYTAPLQERWRVFAEAARNTSKPLQKTLVRDRVGAGIEGRWADWTLEGAMFSNSGELYDEGALATVSWQPDDHWTLRAEAQRYSLETPLRALEAGVRADSASLSAHYAWHESKAVSAGLAFMEFTDGNRRESLSLDYQIRLKDTPTLDLSLIPAIYASRNSLDGVPYFNPQEDLSISLGLDVQHRLWRRYERSLTQRLELTAGNYWQQSFASGVIGVASYSQSWRMDPRFSIDYGIQTARRRYDGDYEYAWTLFASLAWRF